MVNVLSRPRPVRMIGEVDGQLMRLKLSALAVSNNAYRADKPRLPDRLDGGVLGVYMLRATRWRDYVRLAMAALRGTWKDDEMIEATEARQVRLRAKRKAKGAKVLASIDGELVTCVRRSRSRSSRARCAWCCRGRP